MIKFQSYLAGSVFALLLAAHIAMELLDAYPASQYLWHLNIIFAREARPLLQHIDVLTGGNSSVTVLVLAGLALLCIASARTNMRLLAAANCHIALILMVHLAARSYFRTYPRGVFGDDLMALAAKLSLVQVGMIGFVLVLAGACVFSHTEILGRALAGIRGRSLTPAAEGTRLGQRSAQRLEISRAAQV